MDSVVFVCDLADELGIDRSNVFRRAKRDGVERVLLPRMTNTGPQQMAALPKWYAERLRGIYHAALDACQTH